MVTRNDPLQAAKRRAITELLFFASVGDLRRCQRIVRLWKLKVDLHFLAHFIVAIGDKHFAQPSESFFLCWCQIQIAVTMTREHLCKPPIPTIIAASVRAAAYRTKFVLKPVLRNIWLCTDAFSSQDCIGKYSALYRHLAASEGCYKVTEWLIELGSDVNALDRFKRTPLEVSYVPFIPFWQKLPAAETPANNFANYAANKLSALTCDHQQCYSSHPVQMT